MTTNRRKFLSGLAGVSVSPLLLGFTRQAQKTYPISCSSYDWLTFYKRRGKVWWHDPDASARDFVQSGIPAIEPSLTTASEAREMVAVLKKHGIKMPSIYVNSVLHDRTEADKSIENVLSIADQVKDYGAEIIVTNPSPIEWGSKLLKTDEQLIEEARNVERLGEALRHKGLRLAYHTHDTELLAGAREFHHVMQNTSAENVSFCFDVHWIYRGSQNSQVAVFDVLKLYGNRVTELHIRQSINGTWSETFGSGDIDYPRLVSEMKTMKLRPHLVIEQCTESGTPNTMESQQAHRADLEQISKIFQPIL